MTPLAKLWTWIGQIFVPLAIGWAVFVRGGFSEIAAPEGVRFSRGYAGLVVTLIAGSALAWTWALYARLARKRSSAMLVPPNTAFEDARHRSAVISYGTAIVFAAVVLAGLILFGNRYSGSQIHEWDAKMPLAQGFWASRAKAHQTGCPSQPCFAMGQRVNAAGALMMNIYEYILYVRDGALAVLALVFASGLGYLVIVLTTRRSKAR